MRKKSHISLALQIMDGLGDTSGLRHKYVFCIGSILPDCLPSFLTTPHRMECTYELVQKKIHSFIDKYDAMSGCNYRRTLQLGQIAHYIADYFTFPHNEHYEGSMMDHCHYEKDLKQELKRYIKSGDALEQGVDLCIFDSREELREYIEQMHREYMKERSDIYNDVRYIVRVSLVVVASILQMSRAKQGQLVYA
ncbi:MAG: zinc dependent phospholipase C family protein [Lachnospiraceae bacterium]|nr:zinc dependent phospholipase C family protein [Lachnospiraceae bacterium]